MATQWTALQLLQSFGVHAPSIAREERTGEPYDEQVAEVKGQLRATMDALFDPQRTGGADWSTPYVWLVPRAMWHLITQKRIEHDEMFLTWEGSLRDDPLEFVSRFADDDAGEYVITDLEVSLSPAMLRRLLAAADLDHESLPQAPSHHGYGRRRRY